MEYMYIDAQEVRCFPLDYESTFQFVMENETQTKFVEAVLPSEECFFLKCIPWKMEKIGVRPWIL